MQCVFPVRLSISSPLTIHTAHRESTQIVLTMSTGHLTLYHQLTTMKDNSRTVNGQLHADCKSFEDSYIVKTSDLRELTAKCFTASCIYMFDARVSIGLPGTLGVINSG